MRTLLSLIAVLLLSACVTALPPRLDRPGQPSAASIDKLLRGQLANNRRASNRLGPPALIPYDKTVLLSFRLIALEQISGSRWEAEIELLFDFGSLPPAVLGYERNRRGRYRLVLKQDPESTAIIRFYPIAKMYLLPRRS